MQVINALVYEEFVQEATLLHLVEQKQKQSDRK